MVALALTATTYGADRTISQPVDVKDRHGITVLTVSNIQMFRRSAPFFQGVVTNVSGTTLDKLSTITGTVHKRDGSVVQFVLPLGGVVDGPFFIVGTEGKVTYRFSKPWPFSAADFVSVDFTVPSSWESPEDLRLYRMNSPDAVLQRLLRESCALLYENTANKKVSDLTVKEQQDVQSCQEAHLYRPR